MLLSFFIQEASGGLQRDRIDLTCRMHGAAARERTRSVQSLWNFPLAPPRTYSPQLLELFLPGRIKKMIRFRQVSVIFLCALAASSIMHME
jgi:hypothetical protein